MNGERRANDERRARTPRSAERSSAPLSSTPRPRGAPYSTPRTLGGPPGESPTSHGNGYLLYGRVSVGRQGPGQGQHGVEIKAPRPGTSGRHVGRPPRLRHRRRLLLLLLLQRHRRQHLRASLCPREDGADYGERAGSHRTALRAPFVRSDFQFFF